VLVSPANLVVNRALLRDVPALPTPAASELDSSLDRSPFTRPPIGL